MTVTGNKDKRIESFQGEYLWLSNFWPVNVIYDGHLYPSVENAYQAAKLHPSQRGQFRSRTPGLALWGLVRRGQIRGDWEQSKLHVMEQLIAQKFSGRSDLAEKLLATGDAEIIEGNTWGDTFWGVCRGRGENNLGKLLMARRSELRTAVRANGRTNVEN